MSETNREGLPLVFVGVKHSEGYIISTRYKRHEES